jgi:hypothetical protein
MIRIFAYRVLGVHVKRIFLRRLCPRVSSSLRTAVFSSLSSSSAAKEDEKKLSDSAAASVSESSNSAAASASAEKIDDAERKSGIVSPDVKSSSGKSFADLNNRSGASSGKESDGGASDVHASGDFFWSRATAVGDTISNAELTLMRAVYVENRLAFRVGLAIVFVVSIALAWPFLKRGFVDETSDVATKLLSGKELQLQASVFAKAVLHETLNDPAITAELSKFALELVTSRATAEALIRLSADVLRDPASQLPRKIKVRSLMTSHTIPIVSFCEGRQCEGKDILQDAQGRVAL